jgi:hypothetical protein
MHLCARLINCVSIRCHDDKTYAPTLDARHRRTELARPSLNVLVGSGVESDEWTHTSMCAATPVNGATLTEQAPPGWLSASGFC